MDWYINLIVGVRVGVWHMVLSIVFFHPPFLNKNLFANTVKHYFSLKVKMYSALVNVRL